MKTIDATLLANQKIPAGRGFAAATLADNGRLHPSTRVATASYSGGRTIGLECGSYYARIRYKASGINSLEVNMVIDPTDAAQWNTWTTLVSNDVAGALTFAAFWTGTYLVIVYQHLSTGDLYYLRTTNMLAWTGGAVRSGLVANCNLAGVAGGAYIGGVMEAYQQQIYWQAYNETTDTWTAAESAGAVFTTATPEITAFRDTLNNRYVVAVVAQGFVTWAVNAIVAYTRAVGSATWSTGRVLFSGNGLTGSFKSIQFCQRQIGGFWWLSFYRYRVWNGNGITNYQLATSDDGLYFEDAYPTVIPGNEPTLCILPAPSGGQWPNPYLALESGAWACDLYSYWSNAEVVAYHFNTGRGGHQEGGGPNGRGGASPTALTTKSNLVALVDNRAALAAPRLFARFTLTRGLTIAGTQYGQSAGVWFVTDFRYLVADNLLEITATDARGLLASWFAETAYTCRLATVQQLVEWLCALAGVHVVSFDAFGGWSYVVSSFTHAVGENIEASLRSLAELVPFEYVPQENGSLRFYVPTASPSAGYTYGPGAGEHMAWLNAPNRARASLTLNSVDPTRVWATDRPPWFGSSEAVSYLQDIGTPPRNRVAEAADYAAIAAAGRRRTLIVNDRRVNTDQKAVDAAASLIVSAQERKRAGLFEAPPNFALEPGDVVAFSGSGYAAAAGPWRVEQFTEQYNHANPKPFYQLITLRGTA